jgi:hypothetical protein
MNLLFLYAAQRDDCIPAYRLQHGQRYRYITFKGDFQLNTLFVAGYDRETPKSKLRGFRYGLKIGLTLNKRNNMCKYE